MLFLKSAPGQVRDRVKYGAKKARLLHQCKARRCTMVDQSLRAPHPLFHANRSLTGQPFWHFDRPPPMFPWIEHFSPSTVQKFQQI